LAWKDHARCAEHGEWVDVAGPVAATSPVQLSSEQPSRGPQVDPATPSSGAHDHCTILESSRVRGVEWNGGLDASAPRALVLLPTMQIDEPGDVGFALYLLAPKHSPPC
jgi:hypothetical protein